MTEPYYPVGKTSSAQTANSLTLISLALGLLSPALVIFIIFSLNVVAGASASSNDKAGLISLTLLFFFEPLFWILGALLFIMGVASSVFGTKAIRVAKVENVNRWPMRIAIVVGAIDAVVGILIILNGMPFNH